MAMHRRISFSDFDALEAVREQPAAPLPPKYFEYRVGGRDEFFKDLEAYQAAAEIHATHTQNNPSSDAAETPDTEAPEYDRIGEPLPTIHETKIFKKRLLDTLRNIRDFIERRRKVPTWANCFGRSEKFQVGVAFSLILLDLGGLIALGIAFQQIAGLLALGIIFVVFTGCTYFITRKYIYKKRLVEALQIGLAKVERFEKIDDSAFKRIKDGIGATLNPLFWIENERRMEEAIPEELRVPAGDPPPAPAPTGVAELPPPPPLTPPTTAAATSVAETTLPPAFSAGEEAPGTETMTAPSTIQAVEPAPTSTTSGITTVSQSTPPTVPPPVARV